MRCFSVWLQCFSAPGFLQCFSASRFSGFSAASEPPGFRRASQPPGVAGCPLHTPLLSALRRRKNSDDDDDNDDDDDDDDDRSPVVLLHCLSSLCVFSKPGTAPPDVRPVFVREKRRGEVVGDRSLRRRSNREFIYRTLARQQLQTTQNDSDIVRCSKGGCSYQTRTDKRRLVNQQNTTCDVHAKSNKM